MTREMPLADWYRAQAQLKVIRQRMNMARLLHLYALTDAARRALVTDRSPALAGIQLEYIGEKLGAHPSLYRSVTTLASKMMELTTVECGVAK